MTRIASHRGGTLEFGDSTRQGFIATAKMELEEVEFDVHPTADGHIVVHHDPTLDRTTDSTGIIAQLPVAQVCAATIKGGAGGHPLLLAQLCEIFADSPVAFRCEIKAGADGKPYRNFVPFVIEQLKAHDRLASTVFSSFNIETLVEIGMICNRPRLWLVNPTLVETRGIGSAIAMAIEHGVAELGINIDQATPSLRDEIVSSGLDFGCWGAHSAEQIDKALALGAKVFTSDRPSLAIERRTLWKAERNEAIK